MKAAHTPAGSTAFTLVEMIVALAVTTILVVLMLQVFINGATLWRQNDEHLDTFREARAALQMMARDLGSVSPAPNLPDQYPLLALQFNPQTAPEDHVNQEIYALSSVPNTGKSDLCAVGYFCSWATNINAFVLKRQFTESNTTFNNLQQTLPIGAPLSGQQAFNILYARPATLVASTNSTNTQSVDDMASYVWDLEFLTPTTDNPPQMVQWPQGYFWKELPQWVEIHFKALGTTAARKLQGVPLDRGAWFATGSSTGADQNIYKHMILPGAQQFVTRVKLCR